MLPSILFLIPGYLILGASGYAISKSSFIALPLSFQTALPFCAYDCLVLELSAQSSTTPCSGTTNAHCLCNQRAGAGALIVSAAQSCLRSSCSSSTTRLFLDRIRHLCHNGTSTNVTPGAEHRIGHETILATTLKSYRTVIAREAQATSTGSSGNHSLLTPVTIACIVVASVAVVIATILVLATCILRKHRHRNLMKDQISISGRFGHARRLTNLSASEKTASTTGDYTRSSQKTLVELPTPTTYPKPSRWDPPIPDPRGIGVAMTIVDDNIVSPVSAFGIPTHEKPLPPPPVHSRPGSTATVFEEDRLEFDGMTSWTPTRAKDRKVDAVPASNIAKTSTRNKIVSNQTTTKITGQTMDLPLFVTGSAETFYRDSGVLQLHTGITQTPKSKRDSAGTIFEDDEVATLPPEEAAPKRTQSNALNIMRLDCSKRPALSEICIPQPLPSQIVRSNKQPNPEQADTYLKTTPQIVLTSPDPAQQSVLLSAELHSGRSLATTDYLPEYYTRTPQTVATPSAQSVPDHSPSAQSTGTETSPTGARRRKSPTATGPYPLLRSKTAPVESANSPVELPTNEVQSAKMHSFPTPSSYYPDSPLSALDYPPIPQLPGKSIAPRKSSSQRKRAATATPSKSHTSLHIRGKTAPFPLHPVNKPPPHPRPPHQNQASAPVTSSTPPRTDPLSAETTTPITPPRTSPNRTRPETPRLRTAAPSTLAPIDEHVPQSHLPRQTSTQQAQSAPPLPPPPAFTLHKNSNTSYANIPSTTEDVDKQTQTHTATTADRVEMWLRDGLPTPRINGVPVILPVPVPTPMPVPIVAGARIIASPEDEAGWPLRMFDGPMLGGRGKGSLGPGYGNHVEHGRHDGYIVDRGYAGEGRDVSGGYGAHRAHVRMPSRGPGQVFMI